MSLEVKVPSVGESISEVTIAQWIKNSGDYVEMDDVIAELESDKASFELTAEADGVLEVLVSTGETIEVGGLVCKIDTSKAVVKEEPAPQSASQDVPQGEKLVMKVPAVGESISEVTIASWSKNDGDPVEMDEVIAEIESDKASFELAAEADGILKILTQEGEVVEVGAPVCEITVVGGAKKTENNSSPETDTPNNGSAESYAVGHASPAASKILAERGLDPSQIQGTGVDGRVTKEDALKAEIPVAKPDPKLPSQVISKAASQEVAKSTPQTLTSSSDHRGSDRKKMSTLRRTIAKRLVAVKNDTAMLTTFNEVDMQPIMDIRKKYKEMFKEKHEVGLGFMSFFTKACCVALQDFPTVNAIIDGDDIIYHNFCDVSIAVSTPKGLVVPVIRNAEALSFDGVEKEIVRLAKRGRDGKLSIDEMTGGTFTITNGGVFGSMLSTPIINAPQSAILGMHNIVQRPVAIDGQVVIRPIMYVALSYDHRIIDGKESVSFLVRMKQLLEDPTRLLLGV